MPKNAKENNTKKKSTTTKASTGKKVQTKKEVVKKVQTKNSNVKKAVSAETKVEPKVETKKVEEKVIVKEEKGKKKVVKFDESNPYNIALIAVCCLCVILLGALIYTLCNKRIPKTSDGKQIVATLKGKQITADDLYVELKDENGTSALINIVDKYITDKEVKVTDEDKKYVDEVVKYYKDYAEYYNVDLATFLSSYVGLSGITTEKDFYNYVLEDYKKTLAVTKFIGDGAKEEDLKNFYKENYTDKLTVKHILIEVDNNDEKAAEKKAKDLIEQLNKTDAKKLSSKFDELAKNNSDDSATYSKGGLIENISKKDVVEEFWNAANSLKNGEYTKEPVKTSYGYHVILRVSSTKADEYKDIVDKVKKEYAQKLLSEDNTLLAKKWDELRKQYKLSFKDDNMKKDYEKTLKEATKKTEQKTEEN